MISQTESAPPGAQDEIDVALTADLTPDERRARLRERLITEAWRLISTEGLPAVQARRVAQEAGCSVGAIYNVFPDLDELILRANIITMRQLGEAAAAAGATLDPALGVGERVRRLSQVYIGFAFAYERSWRSLFEYRATYRKPYPDWYRDSQVLAFRDLGHGVLGAPVDTPEKLAMVETLWAAVHGVVSVAMDARFRDVSRPQIEHQVDLLTRLLSSGVDAVIARDTSANAQA
jgi:AcrR family transcriptional regulator